MKTLENNTNEKVSIGAYSELGYAVRGYSDAILYGDNKDREIAHSNLAGTLSRMYAHGHRSVGYGRISIEESLKDLKAIKQRTQDYAQLNHIGGTA